MNVITYTIIVAITNSMIVLQMSLSSVLTNLYQFLAKQYFSELATPFSSLYLFIPKIASFQTEFYFLIELEYRRQRKTQDWKKDQKVSGSIKGM